MPAARDTTSTKSLSPQVNAECCEAWDRLRVALDLVPPRSEEARALLEIICRLAAFVDQTTRRAR